MSILYKYNIIVAMQFTKNACIYCKKLITYDVFVDFLPECVPEEKIDPTRRNNCTLTLWQAERHFCLLRFTGAATILSFGRSMFTSLDSIGSAVGKRSIGHVCHCN